MTPSALKTDILYHTGQRTLKMMGDASTVDANAWEQHTYGCLDHVTLYPSAYMVLTEQGYTNVTEVESRAISLALPRCSNVTERKLYYAGTEGVAARLGGGGLDAQQHVIAIDNELQRRADRLFKQNFGQVHHRVLHKNDLDCIMHNEFSRDEFGKWISEPSPTTKPVLLPSWGNFLYLSLLYQEIFVPLHSQIKVGKGH